MDIIPLTIRGRGRRGHKEKATPKGVAFFLFQKVGRLLNKDKSLANQFSTICCKLNQVSTCFV